jgi:hypothetical protein
MLSSGLQATAPTPGASWSGSKSGTASSLCSTSNDGTCHIITQLSLPQLASFVPSCENCNCHTSPSCSSSCRTTSVGNLLLGQKWSAYSDGGTGSVWYWQVLIWCSLTCWRRTASRCSGSMTEGDTFSASRLARVATGYVRLGDILDNSDNKSCRDSPFAPSHLAFNPRSSGD